MPDWTQAGEDMLARLWREGLSASQIATMIPGGFSRNAVIGKVHRLKLDGRRVADRPAYARAPKPKAARRPVRYRPIMDQASVIPPIAASTEPVSVKAWEALPGTAPVPLEALGRDCCRWPIGEDSPFLFCGAAAMPGKSYCKTHSRRSVGTGTLSEQNAVKAAKRAASIEHFAVELVEA